MLQSQELFPAFAGYNSVNLGNNAGWLFTCDDGNALTFDYCSNGVCIHSQQNIWTQLPNFTGTERGGAVVFSINGFGYVGTGYSTTASQYLDDFWKFNPSNYTWAQITNFPGGARDEAVAFVANGFGYVGTGKDSSGIFNDFWKFDPVANGGLGSWAQISSFPGAARYAAAAFAVNAKGYVGTGSNGTNSYNDFYEYDPVSGNWTAVANFGGASRNDAASFGIGSSGYVGTGSDNSGDLSDFWSFDPAINQWAQLGNFSGSSRTKTVGVAAIADKGYIVSGLDTSGPIDQIWEYNPLTDTWLQVSNNTGQPRYNATGFIIGDKVYIGTGYFDNPNARLANNDLNDFWEFSPGCPDCDDNDACTNNLCEGNVCVFPPVDCDDNNSCTDDLCINGGCSHDNQCIDTIAGGIYTEFGTPIPSVTINLSGSSNQSLTTPNNGLYNLILEEGGSYIVTPSKSNDVTTTNGITTLDILIIQKRILAIQGLGSPYKIIAADVNSSSTVTTLDIVFIRAVILVTTPTFPNGKLWAFVPNDSVFPNPLIPFPFPSSRTYTNITESQTNQDFIGIKLGDVNNSWDPNTPKQGAIGNLQMAMGEYDVMPGDEVSIPVKVKDFKGISGYQFTLSWDASILSLLKVDHKALSGYYGEQKKGEGYLTTSWNDDRAQAISLSDDEKVFELKFKVIGAIGTQSEIIIGSELTASEAYNENLNLLNIVPVNGMVKVGNAIVVSHQRSDVSIAIQPNPFTNTTNIIFSIPQDETVSLIIYDLLGKEVKKVVADFETGEHAIEWAGDDDAGESLSRGLYHVRMISGDYSAGMKVVLAR